MVELKFPIYLDHHATTPVDPRVLQEMLPYFSEKFGNASSMDHSFGYDASVAVEIAREKIANTIGARHDEIVFTRTFAGEFRLLARQIKTRYLCDYHCN